MCSKQELDIILRRVSEAYNTVFGNNVVSLLMYGCYARGDYDENSDVDIVGIVKGERADLQERLKEIWDISSEMELEYDIIVSPAVIPYDEYEKYRDDLPYYRNIEKEGVAIVA